MPIRYEQWLSDTDAGFFQLDDIPELRANGLGVTVFEGPIDRDRYWKRMDLSLRLVPRMTQKVVPAKLSTAPPRWVDDPDFDLSYHVQIIPAPGDGSLRALLDFIGPLATRTFEPGRPPWEELLVEGMQGGRTATFRRQHHAIYDGVAGMALARATLDFEPEPREQPLPPMRDLRPLTPAGVFAESWAYEGRRLAGFAARTGRRLRAAASDPRWARRRVREKLDALQRMNETGAKPLSPIMNGRSAGSRFDLVRVPLEQLRAAAHVAGGTINDAYMAAIAGGMYRYHARHGKPIDTLRSIMAVNVREGAAEDIVATNAITGVFFPMRIDEQDPATRVRTIGEDLHHRRQDRDLIETQVSASAVLRRLPFGLGRRLFVRTMGTVDITCSNVPGTPMPFWFCGVRNELLIGIGPRIGAAVNFTMISMAEHATVGINTDPAAVHDPEVLTACVEESFDEVLALALK